MVQAIEAKNTLQIVWDKLPDDYVLPDEPVDNITQPLLASALTTYQICPTYDIYLS